MGTSTLVNDTVTVKRFIPAEKSKYGKASIIVTFNGKDEFIDFNKGVDAVLEAGKTYSVELSISEKGKRYLNKVLGPNPATAAPKKSVAAKPVKAHTEEAKTDKVDWAAKDRAMAAGGLMHDAAALFSPNAVGLSNDEIIERVTDLAVKLVSVKRAVEKELEG